MDMRIRRVGFRFGTDAELTAMHLIESEIESERSPGKATQPLESYMAFARSLPSQFDDHTWLAEDENGAPLACAACWSNSAGDPTAMKCYVYVRKPWRNQGAGLKLAEAVLNEAHAEGRSSLLWTTSGSVPAGEAFSRRLGATPARINRTSELRMPDLDWEMVRSWIDACRGRELGYSLEFLEGPLPTSLHEDAATFHHIMQTAPVDDLKVADVQLDGHHVAEIERHLVESGRERWLIFVREPEGRCVGGTEVTFDSWESTVAHQQNTGIDVAHRGLGLAKWVKASMLERIKARRSTVDVIRTGNAFSNQPMLAINDSLGFKVVEVETDWQGEIDKLIKSLPRPF